MSSVHNVFWQTEREKNSQMPAMFILIWHCAIGQVLQNLCEVIQLLLLSKTFRPDSNICYIWLVDANLHLIPVVVSLLFNNHD